MRANGKIIIVTSADTFLSRGLTEKMAAAEIETTVVRPDVKQLSDLNANIRAMVLFLDGNFANDHVIMTYIRDMSLGKGIPLFLLGKPDELVLTKKILPDDLVMEIFMRPVDINKVLDSIAEQLHKNRNVEQKTILAVDDSGTMLRNIKGMFEDKYQVMLANSAAMAIKSIALKKPDLILLDYDMPIVDGRQVYEMIKSEADFESIPIMFLTGVGDYTTVGQLTKLKPAGYLLKSMAASDIRKSVDDFFSK